MTETINYQFQSTIHFKADMFPGACTHMHSELNLTVDVRSFHWILPTSCLWSRALCCHRLAPGSAHSCSSWSTDNCVIKLSDDTAILGLMFRNSSPSEQEKTCETVWLKKKNLTLYVKKMDEGDGFFFIPAVKGLQLSIINPWLTSSTAGGSHWQHGITPRTAGPDLTQVEPVTSVCGV